MEEINRKVTRRSFIGRLLAIWSGLTAIPFIYVISKYVTPKQRRSMVPQDVIVGKVGEIERNSAKIVKVERSPYMLVRTDQDQYKAFSARCTHLGCVVEYSKEQGGFFRCNCHGSEFDMNGKNVKGPAPTPLPPARVTVKDSDIILSITKS